MKLKYFSGLILLVSVFSFAQNQQLDSTLVDLSNPNATIYTHLHFLQSDSYQPNLAAKTIYGLSNNAAAEKAIRIKKVLDGKGLLVNFDKVPINANHIDSVGYTAYNRYVLFPDRMPEIYVEKIENKWYYSQETVSKIDDLYATVYPWYIEKIQDIIPVAGHGKVFSIEVWQYVAVLLLIVFAVIVFIIIRRITYYILKKVQLQITKNTSFEVDSVLRKLARPIALLSAVGLIDKVFPSLQFSLEVNSWVFLFLNIVQTVFWIYVFLKLVQVLVKIYDQFTQNTHSKLDDQLVPIVHNFLTGVVVVIGAFKLLALLGVDTTTILAGATIGGLAFALASQDTVKNLIGTIMIFVDKPFHIEDWIEAGEVVGTVEKVGFRSTRVRAADTSVYQIPNSKLSEIVINNKGLRLYRRYNTNLGLRYDTPPELIEAFVKGVREIVIAHPETRSDSYNVEFTGFGDSALLIMVNVYFKSLAWGVEQSSKHRLHVAIVKLAAALGVDFAFPSTTVTIEQFPDKSNLAPKYNTSKERIDSAIQEVLENFSEKSSDSDEKRV
jgi:MscS family membrane protein